MKRLIAADIHGSVTFCQKLLERYEKEGAEELILLGDLVFTGIDSTRFRYDPQGVVDLLNPLTRRLYCVEGNGDYGIAKLNPAFFIDQNYKLVRWERWTAFLTHGHHYSPWNPPPMGTAQLMVFGHTHEPSFQQVGDLYCINPGSVSIPRNGSPNSCLLWEEGLLRWLTLDGEEFRREQLPPPETR